MASTATLTRPTSKTDDKIADTMNALTQKVIASIEAGMANPDGWAPPWHTVMGGGVNATTGNPYHGGNILLLSFSGHAGPWATFKQWQEKGAMVKKGSKGTPILVPIPVSFEKEKSDGEKRTVSFTRYRVAYVFAADQVDGWNAPETPVNPEPRTADADAWIAAWSQVVTVDHRSNGACYNRATDTISIPEYDEFKNAAGYYNTFMHEATHSTAHPDRLNREFGSFGSAVYAREELVAELGAAFLGMHYGIPTETIDHGSTDYLANWLRALKGDPKFLWDAATAAQKAVRLLLAATRPDGE